MGEGEVGFENALNMAISGDNLEKSRYDKLLLKEDLFKIRDLLKKQEPTDLDIIEINNMCASIIPKLSRLNDKERKLFALYLGHVESYGQRVIGGIVAFKKFKEAKRDTQVRKQILQAYLAGYRKGVNAFLFAINSTLGLSGNMIDSLTTDSKDIQYNYPPGLVPAQGQQKW